MFKTKQVKNALKHRFLAYMASLYASRAEVARLYQCILELKDSTVRIRQAILAGRTTADICSQTINFLMYTMTNEMTLCQTFGTILAIGGSADASMSQDYVVMTAVHANMRLVQMMSMQLMHIQVPVISSTLTPKSTISLVYHDSQRGYVLEKLGKQLTEQLTHCLFTTGGGASNNATSTSLKTESGDVPTIIDPRFSVPIIAHYAIASLVDEPNKKVLKQIGAVLQRAIIKLIVDDLLACVPSDSALHDHYFQHQLVLYAGNDDQLLNHNSLLAHLSKPTRNWFFLSANEKMTLLKAKRESLQTKLTNATTSMAISTASSPQGGSILAKRRRFSTSASVENGGTAVTSSTTRHRSDHYQLHAFLAYCMQDTVMQELCNMSTAAMVRGIYAMYMALNIPGMIHIALEEYTTSVLHKFAYHPRVVTEIIRNNLPAAVTTIATPLLHQPPASAVYDNDDYDEVVLNHSAEANTVNYPVARLIKSEPGDEDDVNGSFLDPFPPCLL